MTRLIKGENTAVPTTPLTVTVSGPDVDVSAFALSSLHVVDSDDDFVFYNNPSSHNGAIALTAPTTLTLDLAALPAAVDSIAITVSIDAPATLSGAPIDTTITGTGVQVTATTQGLSTERAAALVEIYRRGGGWRVRSVSAGWDAGFAALVREHGVSVDDDADNTNPPPAAPASGVRVVPGEESLSFDKRATLNLRKEAVHRVLLTKGAAGQRARVVIVVDKTTSMSALYKTRTIHRVVERMIPVATQLDDDGNLEPYLYANSFAKLPAITVAGATDWIDTYLHLSGTHGGVDYRTIGGSNEELPILTEIITTVTGRDPVLVLFFTDGGFHSKVPQLKKLLTEASTAPIFWQFIGLGNNKFGVLRALDKLPNRAVDNAGFFAVDDIDTLADDQLYRLLLTEFPDWLTAARTHNIIA